MAWRISGTYLAHCSCQLICPCPVDNPPTGPDGKCRGLLLFHIREGSLDETDLSGTSVVLCNEFPSNLTAGNWKVGLVIDESASDEQAKALERIFHGDEGGPFGEFQPLFGEWLGVERARMTLEDGDKPSASVGDRVNFAFEPLEGADGTPTTVKGAMYGFAPEYRIGRGPGRSGFFGLDFDGVYAETADFEFASEMEEAAARGRV
jgi:hypothetical protein